ncbi:hypothetical protein [Chloroflexus sp.]|uniref:hypothetical protein n=1 Tax=Chloroflexus sp. TaxID=1904827 RepID=UPI00404A7283
MTDTFAHGCVLLIGVESSAAALTCAPTLTIWRAAIPFYAARHGSIGDQAWLF